MEFEFSEEQIAVRDLAGSVFGDFCTDEKLQKFWAGDAPYDTALWRQLGASGLHSLIVDETSGGSGMGMLELMLVLEQQGRTLAPVPLWRHQLALGALVLSGQTPAAALVAGDALATLGLEECYRHSGVGLHAEQRGGDWSLRGRAVAVPLAQQSQLAVLRAETPEGARLFAVDLQQRGIALRPGMLTHREPAADIEFADVPATALAAARCWSAI